MYHTTSFPAHLDNWLGNHSKNILFLLLTSSKLKMQRCSVIEVAICWSIWQYLMGLFVMLICSFEPYCLVELSSYSYLLELALKFWKSELFDAVWDSIVVARIYESSNVFLMFWELDAKHVAIITGKEAETERCFWEIDIPGILQCHQHSLKN